MDDASGCMPDNIGLRTSVVVVVIADKVTVMSREGMDWASGFMNPKTLKVRS